MVNSLVEILQSWQRVGVFDVLLPFLLIFAVVFGITTWINLFGKNKGVNVILAVVIGLMSVRVDYVAKFFSEIFPRLGVGLAVVLSLVILAGMFINDDEKKFWAYAFASVAFVAWIISVAGSFGAISEFRFASTVSEYASFIIGIVAVIGLIIAVSVAGGDKDSKYDPSKGPMPFYAGPVNNK